MPLLIDGNNLAHAMGAEVGRGKLCRLLGRWAEATGEKVCVVFDGPAPPAPLAGQIADERVEVRYAAPREADEVLLDFLGAHSHPRRLKVVSTDREIRRAARARRAEPVRSEHFAEQLLRPPAPPPPDPEPDAKHGAPMSPEQREHWLREFGIE